MKVLLVDDEKFALEGLKNMLNWNSFNGELIGTATNGQDALLCIEERQPDIIISDIKMPLMDGLELAKTLYEKGSMAQMILLSGHGEFEYAQKAIEYQVIHYILKPITREKIEHLNNILIKLDTTRRAEKQDILHILHEDFKEKVLNNLRHNEVAFFDELFGQVLFNTPMSNEAHTTIGIQLLNILYEYLGEIHRDLLTLQNLRTHAMNEYLDLPTYQEKINFLITKYYDVLMSIHTKKQAHTNSIITFATSYIADHFCDLNFNISFLANHMNVSLSYLSTVFKQSMGINLSTYIIDLRIDKAKKLLAHFQYSIYDISLQCGYEDSRYFSKIFKKKLGLSPSEYRNILMQQPQSK